MRGTMRVGLQARNPRHMLAHLYAHMCATCALPFQHTHMWALLCAQISLKRTNHHTQILLHKEDSEDKTLENTYHSEVPKMFLV